MSKLVFSLLVIACCQTVCAQEDTTLLYLRFPILPSFKIIKAPDSTVFTTAELPKKRAIMLMVFDPDCDHCIHQTKELIAHIDLFKKIRIVMVSPVGFEFIKHFYEDFKIADYPNITMGRDPGYFFGTFYKVRSFPSIFLYDKKGNFVKRFDGTTPVVDIPTFL